MKLVEMLGSVKILKCNADLNIEIKDIKYNSKEIEKNDVYVAISGGTADGHSYINEAMAKGAVAVICQRPPDDAALPFIQVEDSRKALAEMSKNYFGRPDEKLHITGVTGTNGKTSTTHFLHHILTQKFGKTVGLIGTNKNIIGDKIIPSKNTTPQSYEIFRMMREMVNSGCTHCVMEVSSHALHQSRVQGIKYNLGIFTNLTHDHLDYHITFENYRKAKLKLADMSEISIINADDDNFKRIKAFTYSIENKNADIFAQNIRYNGRNTDFDVIFRGEKYHISVPIPGEFTVYNSMAAISAALNMGLTMEDIIPFLTSLEPVTGRCEYLPLDKPFDVMIDFAHTPDGMKSVLSMAKNIAKGRIVTVFGCGGDRDKTKRPIMGKIAAAYSDKVIVTSDNSRSERPLAIAYDIIGGIRETDADVDMVLDRETAIKYALENAKKGDLIMLLGKGHELYNEKNGVCTYFNERDIVKKYMV